MKRKFEPVRSPSPLVRTMIEAAKGGQSTPAEMEALRAKIAVRMASGGMASAAPASMARPGLHVSAKIALTATAIAVLGGGGALLATSSSLGARAVAPRRESDPAAVVPAARPSDERAEPTAEVMVTEPAADPVAPSAPPIPTADPPPPPRRSEPRGRAPAEMELLNEAQAALASEPARTLARLSDHRRLYPHGSLEQEREVLAVEALVRLGRSSRARSAAREFERRWPTSGYVRRLRVLVGSAAGSEGDVEP